MGSVMLRYTGHHQPNTDVEVDEKKVEGLIKTGNYEYTKLKEVTERPKKETKLKEEKEVD